MDGTALSAFNDQPLCTGVVCTPSLLESPGPAQCTYKEHCCLSGKKFRFGGKRKEKECGRETEIWFFQARRRYLNSVGRSTVWNGDGFRFAITQSRQSAKYAFFSFILHHFYETFVSRQLARALGSHPVGLADLLLNLKKNESSSAVWPGRKDYLYLKETRLKKKKRLPLMERKALPKAVCPAADQMTANS